MTEDDRDSKPNCRPDAAVTNERNYRERRKGAIDQLKDAIDNLSEEDYSELLVESDISLMHNREGLRQAQLFIIGAVAVECVDFFFIYKHF